MEEAEEFVALVDILRLGSRGRRGVREGCSKWVHPPGLPVRWGFSRDHEGRE